MTGFLKAKVDLEAYNRAHMKILLVHNFYGSQAPSGENAVFEAEKILLEQMGHKVKTFVRLNDDIRNKGISGILKGAASVPWNPFTVRSITKCIRDFQPDVVHAHNTFPLISPSIFHAVGSQAAMVLTLHNYRLLCPAAVPMRSGNVCTECIDRKSVLPSLMHGCYRRSRVATVPLAVSVALHRLMGTWEKKVDAFIALSEFQRQLMSLGGLAKNKIHVKPNFYPGSPEVIPYVTRPNYIVFVGRLSEEKGVRTLVDAWRSWGKEAPQLRMVGDGPLREELEMIAANLPVEFLGQVSYEDTQAQIANAQLLLLPSECFEGFPMVVREAFALGTPVAVTNLGPLPSIVEHGINGIVFEAGNPDALRVAIANTMTDLPRLKAMARGARQAFETLYHEKVNYEMLIEIYSEAIKVNQRV